eukprot:6831145-Pyramimonas_sp.AAC.1
MRQVRGDGAQGRRRQRCTGRPFASPRLGGDNERSARADPTDEEQAVAATSPDAAAQTTSHLAG